MRVNKSVQKREERKRKCVESAFKKKINYGDLFRIMTAQELAITIRIDSIMLLITYVITKADRNKNCGLTSDKHLRCAVISFFFSSSG